MKKSLLMFAVGLIVGLGTTTGAKWYFGRDDTSLAAELAAATDTVPADSAALASDDTTDLASESPPDSTASGADDLAGNIGPVADTVPAGGVIAAASAAAEPNAATSLDTTRLAEMFASMQAREAAKVLEHMDDDEVQVILAQLGTREAAAILSNLTPERAAVISREVIQGERSIP